MSGLASTPVVEGRSRRLGPIGLAVRLTLAVAGLVALAHGTVHTDHAFPFGPMSQYAGYYDPNGEVASTYVEADTTAGTRVRVPLTLDGIVVKRAEIEGHQAEFTKHPAQLGALITAQRVRHPDQPQYVRVYLRGDVTRLRDARPAGTFVRTLAEWGPR